MSGIENFQIFQQKPCSGSLHSGDISGGKNDGDEHRPFEVSITPIPEGMNESTTPTAMPFELTQHEAEESGENSANGRQASRAHIPDAWGLLRRQSSDREEFKLYHRMKDFKRDTYTIGRSSKCDITVADNWISTTHCSVYCDYTQPKLRVFIEDSSANGTFINNSLTRLRKGERLELRSGDEIFLLNPRKPENAVKLFTSFVFINLRERLMAFREISIAPNLACCNTSVQQQRNGGMSLNSRKQSQHIEEKYIIGDQIGSGMSGQVYACINKITKEHCAVKIIDTRKFSLNPGLSVVDLRDEAILMQEFDHPNIIKVVDTFQTSTMIYIVMELLRGGDLFDRIIEKERYSEESARQLMIQVFSAVEYLHGKQIIHRDLKPENILLVSAHSDVEVKVTDFGLAKKANRDGLKTFCGTPQYFAPEVLQRKTIPNNKKFVRDEDAKDNMAGTSGSSSGRYGTAVDMWSLGVILYILLSGTFPFNDDEEILRAKYSLTGIEWNGVSPGAKHLIRSLMTLRADQRYTVQQALRHPWICGIPFVPGTHIVGVKKLPVPVAQQIVPVAQETGKITNIKESDAISNDKAGGVMHGKSNTKINAVALKKMHSCAPVKQVSSNTVGAKRTNLRRGMSLFAPLELKYKSSQEFANVSSTNNNSSYDVVLTNAPVTLTGLETNPTSSDVRKMPVSSSIPSGHPTVLQNVGTKKTASIAPVTNLSPHNGSNRSNILVKRTPVPSSGQTPSGRNLGAALLRTELYIDLDHSTCTSSVIEPSPSSSIVHLSVTNATSCLHGLFDPLLRYCDQNIGNTHLSCPSNECSENNPAIWVTSSTPHMKSGKQILPVPSAPIRSDFKRATSFDDCTKFCNEDVTKPTLEDVLFEEDVIEEYSSCDECVSSVYNKAPVRRNVSTKKRKFPSSAGGNKDEKSVKRKGDVRKGCLKTSMSPPTMLEDNNCSLGTIGNCHDLPTVNLVNKPTRQRSVSFSKELHVIALVDPSSEALNSRCGLPAPGIGTSVAIVTPVEGVINKNSATDRSQAKVFSFESVSKCSDQSSSLLRNRSGVDASSVSASDNRTAKKTTGIKRTQSSLEQAWNLKMRVKSTHSLDANENAGNYNIHQQEHCEVSSSEAPFVASSKKDL